MSELLLQISTALHMASPMIDKTANTYIFVLTVFVIFIFKKQLYQFYTDKNFQDEPEVTTIIINLFINLLFFLLFSFVYSTLKLMDLPTNTKVCIFYTLNAALYCAYVFSYFIGHRLLKVNMHPISKLLCIMANALILVQGARLVDRLVLKTDILMPLVVYASMIANLILVTTLSAFTLKVILGKRRTQTVG